jgi:hypothetical protein
MLLVPVIFAAPAQAQATRTWVSGVGDDVNPCSRTAPCKTFAGAISKTATGGEINCLDSGGFGTVTITKSISILCDGVVGGVLAAGTNGVNVNGAGAIVHLRGLDIDGVGTGLLGINFINGAELHVEQCVIKNFRSGGALGISFAPATGTTGLLFVSDTLLANNGVGSVGGGILVKPTGTGVAKSTINRAQAFGNLVGIKTDGTGSTGGMNTTIINTVVAGGSSGIVATTPGGGATQSVMVSKSASLNNSAFGILVDGSTATVRIGDSTISGNATGVGTINSGVLNSYKNNNVNGNGADGTPITAVPGANNGLN